MKYDLNKKRNRFAARTLEDFSKTLFVLLMDNKFENITVNQLCEECNYPRATFYNYFDDIDDLLDYCWYVMSNQIVFGNYQELTSKERTLLLFNRMYDYLSNHKEAIDKILCYNTLEDKIFDSFKKYITKKIGQLLEECMNTNFPVSREIMISHISNTIQLMIECCFMRENKISKQEANDCLVYLLGNIDNDK